MSKEIPFQNEVDKLVAKSNYLRPLVVAEANLIINLLKTTLNNLDKKTKRKTIAMIFAYLTAGSSPNTHASGKTEGKQKKLTKISSRQRHHKRKAY